MPISLTSIYRYPVKSCRGESLDRAVVEPWGLAGDRRWMLIGDDGVRVTAREYPRLVLVTPSLDNDDDAADNSNKIRFEAPGLPDLAVPFPQGGPGGVPPDGQDPGGDLVPVTIGGGSLLAARAGEEADEWFTRITGEPVRLVYLDDPARRAVDPAYGEPGDRVSFADGYPLLLISEQSLDRLNDWVFEGRFPEAGPLPPARFRPNVVAAGAPAFAEDAWKRIRIGDAAFRVAKRCDRCVLTTVDPGTGVKGREPLVTLGKHRRWDGKIWFGVNLIPDLPARGSAVIRPGDPVQVLA